MICISMLETNSSLSGSCIKEKLQRYMMENKDIVKHFYEVIVSEIQ